MYLFASADIKLKTGSFTTKWNSNKKQHKWPKSKSQVFNICHEREAAGRVFPSELWRALPAHRGRLLAAEFYLVWKSWTPSARAGWLLEAQQSGERRACQEPAQPLRGWEPQGPLRERPEEHVENLGMCRCGPSRMCGVKHKWVSSSRRVNLAAWHEEREVPGKQRSFTRSCDHFKLIQSTCFFSVKKVWKKKSSLNLPVWKSNCSLNLMST